MPISDADLGMLGQFAGKAPIVPDTTKSVSAGVNSSDELKNYLKPNAQMMADQVGVVPHLAIPESPLSAFERAAFGWMKTPKAQSEYLEDKFGKGNVQLSKMDEDNAGFIVKTKDGAWRQIDPHGLSDIPLDILKLDPKGALDRIKNFNLHDTIGAGAQLAGEEGSTIAGAVAGAAALAPYGAPLGPLGMGAMGVVGGALGGGAGGLAEAGVRKALSYIQDKTGQAMPGAQDMTAHELKDQVIGSMLFGGAQELAGPFLKAGAKGSAKIFATLLEKLGDTPASKEAQAGLIKALSGMKDGLARAWADDPHAVEKYMPQAIADRTNNSDRILVNQKSALEDFYSKSQSAMRGLGRQYQEIESKASGKVISALEPDKTGSNPIMDAFSRLQEEEYIQPAKSKANAAFAIATDIDSKGDSLAPMGRGGQILRDVSGTNEQALKNMTKGYESLLSNNGKTTYKDLRIWERNIENNLFGQNQVSDGTLRNIMGQMRSAINTVQSKGLHEVDPALSGRLAELNAKYGPAKELLGDLGNKTQDQRLDAFLKQVIRNDGSYNAEMMNSVGELLGIDNPTKDILHMEVAKQASPTFTGSGNVNIFGVKMPASPRATGMLVNNAIAPMQDLQKGVSDAFTPAFQKLHSFYKALPESVRTDMVKNPQAISSLSSMISGSVIQEQQDKSKLLQDAGAFQNSQFGQ